MDGKQTVAKLQHPLGVAYNAKEQTVYVADTYNHKIKCIDANSGICNSCNITYSVGEMPLTEPGGLCVNPAGDRLYIADTNNHRIEKVDLKNMTMKSWKLDFYEFENNSEIDAPFGGTSSGPIIQSKQIQIKPEGGSLTLQIALMFNENDTKFAIEAPQKWNIFLPNENWLIGRHSGTFIITQSSPSGHILKLEVKVPGIRSSHEEETVAVAFKLNLCSRNICFPKQFSMGFPILYSNGEKIGDISESVKALISNDSVTLL